MAFFLTIVSSSILNSLLCIGIIINLSCCVCCSGFASSLSSSASSKTITTTRPTTSMTATTARGATISSASANANARLPIVYTIAGSDSGGGAGIQADLHTIHTMGCYGCSAITCLTAQNSVGVSAMYVPPTSFLQQQLDCLLDDFQPVAAIKVGALGTKEVITVVGQTLQQICQQHTNNQEPNNNNISKKKVWIVVDPVMISTSGSKLLADDAIEAMIEHIFPYADIITPNKFEAETLLGRKLQTPHEVELGAKELLQKYTSNNSKGQCCRSVLIKGGHTLLEENNNNNNNNASSNSDDTTTTTTINTPAEEEIQSTTLEYAQDYLLSSDVAPVPGHERMCDPEVRGRTEGSGEDGVWIRSSRWKNSNTHGTGCTLSSAIASALALGEESRRRTSRTDSSSTGTGAINSIQLVDACCLAKAYVSAGIQRGVQYGESHGPVVHTEFPSTWKNYPTIVRDLTTNTATTSLSSASTGSLREGFRRMKAFAAASTASSSLSSTTDDTNMDETDDAVPILGRIIPIVDTVEHITELCTTPGITDIQLRIKDTTDSSIILERIRTCQGLCGSNNVRLWINDYWKEAMVANCFGVHVGQEDLFKCWREGGLQELQTNNIALGISTHSYSELSVAIGFRPSYISLGPVFATTSKKVQFEPQGLHTVMKWKQLIPPSIPLVTIGGINTIEDATANKVAGSDCIAVIGAITKVSNTVATSVQKLNDAMV